MQHEVTLTIVGAEEPDSYTNKAGVLKTRYFTQATPGFGSIAVLETETPLGEFGQKIVAVIEPVVRFKFGRPSEEVVYKVRSPLRAVRLIRAQAFLQPQRRDQAEAEASGGR